MTYSGVQKIADYLETLKTATEIILNRTQVLEVVINVLG